MENPQWLKITKKYLTSEAKKKKRDTSIKNSAVAHYFVFFNQFFNIVEENYCELQRSGVLQQQHVRPQHSLLRVLLQRRQYFYEIS